jgi:hypothetical protein
MAPGSEILPGITQPDGSLFTKLAR